MGLKEVITQMRDQAVIDRKDANDALIRARVEDIAEARACYEFNRGYVDAMNDVLRTLIEKGLVQP